MKAVEDREEDAKQMSATVGSGNKAKPVSFEKKPSDSAGHVFFVFAYPARNKDTSHAEKVAFDH